MLEEVLWCLATMSIGAFLGVATLPWHEKMREGGPLPYICVWAGMWPLLLLCLFGVALKAYRDAWGCYLDNRKRARQRARAGEDV